MPVCTKIENGIGARSTYGVGRVAQSDEFNRFSGLE